MFTKHFSIVAAQLQSQTHHKFPMQIYVYINIQAYTGRAHVLKCSLETSNVQLTQT